MSVACLEQNRAFVVPVGKQYDVHAMEGGILSFDATIKHRAMLTTSGVRFSSSAFSCKETMDFLKCTSKHLDDSMPGLILNDIKANPAPGRYVRRSSRAKKKAKSFRPKKGEIVLVDGKKWKKPGEWAKAKVEEVLLSRVTNRLVFKLQYSGSPMWDEAFLNELRPAI
uniref:Uncharacterized protein n=1 Tax=Octactis speculum TaxID=3111310 RepID=A0A7S2C487_9STRA|mmetsp:Transcript_31311/g.42391  ORF Transcript_31311/g.42391 Transcript_31311/m.42391 type:complete len:168 (+) Transcript_31311:334-837(+)